jgi:hypothetical protein
LLDGAFSEFPGTAGGTTVLGLCQALAGGKPFAREEACGPKTTNSAAVPYPSDFGHGIDLRIYYPKRTTSLKGQDVLLDLFPFRAKLREDSFDIHELPVFGPVSPSHPVRANTEQNCEE